MHITSIQEFQGLKLTTQVSLGCNIAAIIGRNGAGKSRLLQAIAEGKVQVELNSEAIPRERIQLLTMDQLQPSLTFGFDRLQHRDGQKQAVAQYVANRGKFNIDPKKSIELIGHQGMMGRNNHVNIHVVAHVVSRASDATGKDVNALDEQDVTDHFSSTPMAMGSLNVTATMLAYWDHLEQNEFHEFRNTKYGESLSYWEANEFKARFGPPPWDVFNEFLCSVLDGRYHIEKPTRENLAAYEAKIFREDGLAIDPNWLSSGEKVLMWLCLSMYASNMGRMANPPQLLLLDEPDAALHPQMVQKLHQAMKAIADRFGSNIIFTTHSPTTVALCDTGSVFQVSEHDLQPIEKDAAIAELLVGMDQVSIQYTNRRQVYVESNNDAEIYGTLFRLLKTLNKLASAYISLSFIPAAPKLSPSSVQQLLKAHLGDLNAGQVDTFIQALNGQGNCAQVVGAVESLVEEGSATVHGVIDWDLTNNLQPRVHVLGAEHFYSIENAILNPLTLGLYLLHNYPEKLAANDYGLANGFDPTSLYTNPDGWQAIADGVTKRVLQVDDAAQDVECIFLNGEHVRFDRRYVQMKGHDLERLLKNDARYPFLCAISKRPTLMMDVVQRGIKSSHGRTMPRVFADLFSAIQSTR